MAELDISKLDIFTPTHTGQFNACVGKNGAHDLRTYAEGYLQASEMLLDNIIENALAYERDTLVHPIMYSARHAIELSIKHVLVELNKTDIQTEERLLRGHGLKRLWDLFKQQAKFDRRIIEVIDSVDPIVNQLDQADPDAQDFRYPTNSEGSETLDGKAIVDLVTVKQLVDYLKKRLLLLFRLTEVIVDERHLNAFTKELNREELRQLSIDLPEINEWEKTAEFDKVKECWKSKLGLSNSAFSRAINFIKSHREFSGNIGKEYKFFALNKDTLEQVLEKAYEIQQERIANRNDRSFKRLTRPDPSYAAYESLKGTLSQNAIAEIETIFYLSRDRRYSEEFDQLYDKTNKSLAVVGDDRLEEEKKNSFVHVFSKTNFIVELIGGLRKIGEVTLAEDFKKYIVHVEVDLADPGLEMEFK
ncbi:MAG: hypothetical protein JAY67_12120 [Candidatus Thiodiazotropha taylori]|nr:hypothetical protein [Candidatus Thiodiazotropha taylori]